MGWASSTARVARSDFPMASARCSSPASIDSTAGRVASVAPITRSFSAARSARDSISASVIAVIAGGGAASGAPLLNYALGLTRVKLRDYVIAHLGMLPGTLLYVYYGRLAGAVAEAASGVQTERGAGYYAVLGLGLVATLVVTTIVTRIASRTLKAITDAPAPRVAEDRQ